MLKNKRLKMGFLLMALSMVLTGCFTSPQEGSRKQEQQEQLKTKPEVRYPGIHLDADCLTKNDIFDRGAKAGLDLPNDSVEIPLAELGDAAGNVMHVQYGYRTVRFELRHNDNNCYTLLARFLPHPDEQGLSSTPFVYIPK